MKFRVAHKDILRNHEKATGYEGDARNRNRLWESESSALHWIFSLPTSNVVESDRFLSPDGDRTGCIYERSKVIWMKSAKTRSYYVILLLASVLAAMASAQDRRAGGGTEAGDGNSKLGYPQDWSSRHLLITGHDSKDPLGAGWREPRHVYNRVMRETALREARRHPRRRHPIKVDWAVSLENGFVPANQFPAKYRFDVSAQSCSGDYVLFALTVSSGTQANLVGINNLYTEASSPCNGGVPFVSFAYNTLTNAGQIRTSPTLSADGKKVAFVESTTGGSYFHVLVLPSPIPSPPASSVGTVRSPQTPSSCTNPTTVGCMSTVKISNGANTDSSPWIDYNTDTAYVGTDDGKLYKISPVFGGGAPAVISDADWPVTVVTSGASNVLTDPIVDDSAARIFMGDANGYLYAISLNNPAKATAARVPIGWVGHGAGTGVVDAPIVVNDSANPSVDQVFAFTGCSNVVGVGGAINQIPANFTSASTYSTVDLGSGHGNGDCTGGDVHAGVFDNQFWISGTTGGHMLACGFVSGTNGAPLIPSNPKMYMFLFDSLHQITSVASSSWVINSTVGDECSPLTEFFNGTTDRMFFGVGGTGDGFIESSTLTATASQPSCGSPPTSSCVTAPHALGGTSGIVIDNQVSNGGTNIYFSTVAKGGVNGQNCKVSGGTNNPFCAVKLTQSALQ